MSLVACTIGGLSIYAINEFWVRSHHFEQAAERAYKGEALNRLVTAVVMEARGIYAAADIAAAAPFADGMVKNLDAMDKLITGWAPLVPAEQKAGFDKLAGRSKEFRTFRLETVRLAKESGPQAASQQGNNEANRANRKAYQAEIDSIVKNDIAELEVVKAGVDAFSTAIFWVIVAVTVAGVGTGAAFGLYIGTRQLSAPIRRVSQVMSEVADGNLDAAVPYLGRKDEIGEMAAAVEVFKTNGREVRRMNAQESAMRAKSDDLQAGMAVVVDAAAAGDFSRRINKDYGDDNLNRFAATINALLIGVDNGVSETSRVIEGLARGDLTEKMDGEFRGVFAELQSNVNQTLAKLRETMREVRSSTEGISGNAGESRSAADDLSRRTEQQAAALEETSAALDEITAVVRNSTDRAQEASAMVAETKQKTEESANVVRDAVSAMDRIELLQSAATDSLTEALTRRAFKQEADQLISLAIRHQHNLSTIVLDIDRFKSVNDTHGHAAGDQVLRAVAATCKANLRAGDLFGRLGGEELESWRRTLDRAGIPGLRVTKARRRRDRNSG